MNRAPGCRPARAFASVLGWGSSGPPLPALAQGSGGANGQPPIRLLPRPGGVLGLMGYNVTPDGSTNALQLNRSTPGGSEASPTLTLGQLGFGFTVSEAFPLFLEGYIGYARYDPRAVLTGELEWMLPFRWNNITGTIGIGYDFRLTEQLYLRPIINFSLGYAASDATLLSYWLAYRSGGEVSALRDIDMAAWGIGGSLTLAYYDFRPERDIDIELRYTQIELHTFEDTIPALRGSSTAQTLGLWAGIAGRWAWRPSAGRCAGSSTDRPRAISATSATRSASPGR